MYVLYGMSLSLPLNIYPTNLKMFHSYII